MELSSISIAITSLIGALFNPGSMFTTGVNGAWCDPSDFSTMFQDAAGTTPVTAVGQPVGRILDKSGRGNHAYNPSGNSANFPVLSARYNLLTKTEQFDDAIWSKQNVTIAADAISAPNGTITADALIPSNATNTFSGIYRTEFTSPQKTFSAYVKKGSKRWAMLLAYNGNNNCWFDLDNKVPGTRGANFSSSDITDIGNGWLRISATLSAALGGNANIGLYCSDADNSTQCIGDGVTAGIYIWGADLRVANDALNQPAYQRVNTSSDYDTVGFKPYLSFNGVNQWLQTNSIDFTYGDKVFVSAGVRKLSDAVRGIVVELSTTTANNGSFGLDAPTSTAPNFATGSGGTSSSGAIATGYAAPINAVLSSILSISTDQAILRVNGTQAASSTSDQGTGNYGNYPLYIGARAGSSLWFNGRLYSLVVAGKQASASEIASTETWLNQKTGAY